MGYACHYKHEAVARLLVRGGATIDAVAIDEAKAQGKPKLAKWLRRVRGHTTPLHWACEDRDREGLLLGLRSDEFERALPPLATLCKDRPHAPQRRRLALVHPASRTTPGPAR